MRSFRHIALGALLTIGAFSAVTYTSCSSSSKDKCADVNCQNGGSCNSTTGACTCPTGYTGTLCDTLVRTAFIGAWTGTDVCNTGTYTINISLAASSTNDITVIVTNPGGYGTSVTASGTVTSANQLTFTSVNVGNSRSLSGTMTFTGNTMAFQYSVTQGTTTDNCTGSYTKQ